MADPIITPDMARRLAIQQQLKSSSAEGPMLDGMRSSELFRQEMPEGPMLSGVPAEALFKPSNPSAEGPLLNDMAADRLFRQPDRQIQMTPSRGYTPGEAFMQGAQLGARGGSVMGAPVRGAYRGMGINREILGRAPEYVDDWVGRDGLLGISSDRVDLVPHTDAGADVRQLDRPIHGPGTPSTVRRSGGAWYPVSDYGAWANSGYPTAEDAADAARGFERITNAGEPVLRDPVNHIGRPERLRAAPYVPAANTAIGSRAMTQDGYTFTKVGPNSWTDGDMTLTNEMFDDLSRPDPELERALGEFTNQPTRMQRLRSTPELGQIVAGTQNLGNPLGDPSLETIRFGDPIPTRPIPPETPSRMSRVGSALKTGIKGALTPANIVKDAIGGASVGGLSAMAGNLAGRPDSAGLINIPQDSLIQQQLPEEGVMSQAAMLRAIEQAAAEKELRRQAYIDEVNARFGAGTLMPGARIEEIRDRLGPVRGLVD